MKRFIFAIFTFLTIDNVFSQSSWASFVLTNTACVGSSVNVVANTGTNVVTGYTWTTLSSGPIIASPNSSITSITYPSAGTFTIVLAADDGSTIAKDSNVVVVGPKVTSSGPTWPICPPPTSQGYIWCIANGASSYTWTPGNVVNDTLLLYPYPSVSTTYTVIGKDVNGCTSLTTQYVQVLPQVNIYVTAPSIACDGSNVCFTESGGDLVVWVWNDGCGNIISGGPFVCFTASLACGNTYTIGGNNMSCMNYTTFSVNVSPCTEVKELEINDYSIELSPNPVNDKFNLKINSDKRETTQLELSDISGRVVSRSKCSFNSESVYTVDVSELSPGIYFVRIISGDKISKPVKIIKE